MRIISQNRASSYEFENVNFHMCIIAITGQEDYYEIEYIVDFQGRSEKIAVYRIFGDDYLQLSKDKQDKLGYNLFEWVHQRYAEGCSVFCMPKKIEIVTDNKNNCKAMFII